MESKIKVELCVGTYCHLMGSSSINEALEQLPKNLKNRVDLQFMSCMNQCSKGSKVKIDGQLIEHASADRVLSIIKQKLGINY